MKKLALFFIAVLLTSVAVLAFGQDRAFNSENLVRYVSDCSSGDGNNKKREVTSNGVQVKLEICGSDLDNWEIDAVNPTGQKYDCRCSFTLRGKDKDDKSVEITRSRTITVSSTASGWFMADSESLSREGKKFEIMSFDVSCS